MLERRVNEPFAIAVNAHVGRSWDHVSADLGGQRFERSGPAGRCHHARSSPVEDADEAGAKSTRCAGDDRHPTGQVERRDRVQGLSQRQPPFSLLRMARTDHASSILSSPIVVIAPQVSSTWWLSTMRS
jgi:hypothetical protein